MASKVLRGPHLAARRSAGIVVYADSPTDRDTIRRALPGEEIEAPDRDPGKTRPLPEERTALTEADCVIFAYASEPLRERIPWITDWSQRLVGTPRILVTVPTRNLARRLAPLAFTAIVWFEDLHRVLPAALEEARQSSVFDEMVAWLREANLPPVLLHALVLALTAPTPFKRVSDLARAAQTYPSTLRHGFREAVGGAYRLEDFLSALQVLHAHRIKALGGTWAAAAQSVTISIRTLRTKANAWPGCSLRQLQNVQLASLRDLFHEERLALLKSSIPPIREPQAAS